MNRAMGRALRRTMMAGLVAVILPVAAKSDTIIAGRSAQALRCAAYVGMAARFGADDGYLDASDVESMTGWSAQVLGRWVPLPTAGRLAAYRVTLGELGTRSEADGLIARYIGWCVHAFPVSP